MSAAAAGIRTPHSAPPGPFKEPYCQTPHFFFRSLSRYCNYTEQVFVGLILDSTVGWSKKKKKWARLSIERFAGVSGKCQRMAEMVLARLESPQMGWIQSRPAKRGGREYRVKLPIQSVDKDLDAVYGKCGTCDTDGTMDPDRGYCRAPHSYFLKLPSCVSHAVWLVVGVILDETVGWNEESAALRLDDFTRDTGLPQSSVCEALIEAETLGLIGNDHSGGGRGLANSYWVYPEMFGRIEKPPQDQASVKASAPDRNKSGSGSEEKEKEEAEDSAETPAKEAKNLPVDFVTKPICRCRNCGAVGPVEIVSSDVGGDSSRFPPHSDGKTRVSDRAGPPADEKPAQTSTELERYEGKQESFALFWQLFVAAGKALNEGDRRAARKLWDRYDEPTHERIVRWVVEQMKTAWKDQSYTPMPVNALKGEGWTRVAAKRVVPDVKPKSKMDQVLDIYEELYAKGPT